MLTSRRKLIFFGSSVGGQGFAFLIGFQWCHLPHIYWSSLMTISIKKCLQTVFKVVEDIRFHFAVARVEIRKRGYIWKVKMKSYSWVLSCFIFGSLAIAPQNFRKFFFLDFSRDFSRTLAGTLAGIADDFCLMGFDCSATGSCACACSHAGLMTQPHPRG